MRVCFVFFVYFILCVCALTFKCNGILFFFSHSVNIQCPIPLDEHFDGVYEIEATAHAKDKVECYKELLRVVKPGGYFGSYEWCLTDKYDPNNETHKELKWMIEIGDGLPDISTTDEVVAALKEAGWEVLEAEDLVYKEQDCHISWYDNLVPKYELSHNFQHTEIGRQVLAVCILFFLS